MVTLGAASNGRKNNLNLIRMIAAFMVLISHAVPIGLGTDVPEPFQETLGFTMGRVAVYAFFAISGYLILQSWERRSSFWHWASARGLRIFPGLFVALVFTAFILGPLMTTLTREAYFATGEPWSYVFTNLTLVKSVNTLPGVLAHTPHPLQINASLWTLLYEVIGYAAVAVAGVFGFTRRGKAFWFTVIGYLGFYALSTIAIWLVPEHDVLEQLRIRQLRELSFPFFVGMLFFVYRHHLPMSFVGALGLMGVAAAFLDTLIFDEVFIIALTYWVFWLGFCIRRRSILRYNRLGDFSYGFYIYAYPMQQMVAWALGEHDPWINVVMAAPLTLACAILSWNLVEKPALERKRPLGDWALSTLRLPRRARISPAE